MSEGHMIKDSWLYMKKSKWFDDDETAKMERIYKYWEHNQKFDQQSKRRFKSLSQEN